MSVEELGRGGSSSSSRTANPTSDEDCNSGLSTSEEHATSVEGEEQEEKLEGRCASISFKGCITRATIEEKLRGGSSSSMAYTITAAEAADLCSNTPNERRKAKADGKKQNSSKSCRPNPEPCAHAYVGAINKMEGAQPTWFCTKRLTSSDVSKTQNRLLFPKSDMEKLLRLLTPREREELLASSKGIKAAVIDEMGRRWDMRLNLWASKSYNLNGDWKWLVEKLELSKGDAVKVGAFRYPDESEGEGLGFVVLVDSRASMSRETNVKSIPNND